MALTSKLSTAALLLAACALARAAGPNRLTPAERRDGWRLLFDGSTTAGWEEITGKPFPDSWTVEDGCLKALPRPDGKEDIRTKESFRSFDLEFDWKLLPGGNSGVKYLIQRTDEWRNAKGRQARARGLEYQLIDNAVPELKADTRRFAGSLYSLIAPRPPVNPRLGEFNHSRIVVDGHHVEHWLNGVKIVEFDTTDPAVVALLRHYLPKGSPPDAPLVLTTPISLQNHTGEAWFRNIKIRVLPAR